MITRPGIAAAAECWAASPADVKATLKASLDRRHKPAAAEADAKDEEAAA
jgi:hypothetical protein